MFELSLICPQESVEELSDALDALDALSVSVEDADAQTDAHLSPEGGAYSHFLGITDHIFGPYFLGKLHGD